MMKQNNGQQSQLAHRHALAEEEHEEASRFDRIYRTEGEPQILPPGDWTKFDSIQNPTGGYVYSVQLLGDVSNKHILDLGCGSGYLSVVLAKRGAHVKGIDISKEAIKASQATATMNRVEGQTQFSVGSVYALPFADSYFDCVIGVAILHHISDKARLAKQLHRVLKPAGKAVFCECFGQSTILERLRLLVPVPVDEEDKTHWNDQLKYNDLDPFNELFKVTLREFQLLSRLDRIVSSPRLVSLLGRLDVMLLESFPILRKYARSIVIELKKQ